MVGGGRGWLRWAGGGDPRWHGWSVVAAATERGVVVEMGVLTGVGEEGDGDDPRAPTAMWGHSGPKPELELYLRWCLVGEGGRWVMAGGGSGALGNP